jgi:hypothetical protein
MAYRVYRAELELPGNNQLHHAEYIFSLIFFWACKAAKFSTTTSTSSTSSSQQAALRRTRSVLESSRLRRPEDKKSSQVSIWLDKAKLILNILLIL